MDKNIRFLKGPKCKIQTQFDGNFVKSQAKEYSLKYKKKFQVSIEIKINKKVLKLI